ncbi:reverse transcriptase domain-containing protein [Tanacetum coccineum]
MTQLLVKDAPFNFSKECIQAFDTLKRELTQAPIMIKPDWSLPFEIMCDATDHLSRLEHPDLGKLTRAEIRDLFPEERLMAIFDKDNEPCVLTGSYEDAWTMMKHHKFFDNVTADHPEDITASPPPQGKSSRPEAQAFPTSDAGNVVNFLRRLFARFGKPKALIGDMGTHLCNYQIEKAMKRYGVIFDEKKLGSS